MIEADSVLSTPRTDSSSNTNLVQFAAFAAAAKLAKTKAPFFEEGSPSEYLARREAQREARLAEAITASETLSETCKNHRLRLSRRDAWAASHLTD